VKANFIVDVVIFSLFLLGSEPSLTGSAVHEWLNLTCAAAVLAHLLMHGNWLVLMTSRQSRRMSRSLRINYIVDLALAVSFVTVILSGLLISRVIIGGSARVAGDSSVWRELHSFFANLLIFLVALHFALHWRWITHICNRFLAIQGVAESETRAAVTRPN
jgi:hypothetical protein